MYIDLLVQLKNAQAVKKENIKFPYSKNDSAIAEILAANKFINTFEKKGRGIRRILDIKLKYDNNEGAISGLAIMSKSSRRIYLGYKEIKPVKYGYGIMIISTPMGIMTDKEARKNKVGGEALFKIW